MSGPARRQDAAEHDTARRADAVEPLLKRFSAGGVGRCGYAVSAFEAALLIPAVQAAFAE